MPFRLVRRRVALVNDNLKCYEIAVLLGHSRRGKHGKSGWSIIRAWFIGCMAYPRSDLLPGRSMGLSNSRSDLFSNRCRAWGHDLVRLGIISKTRNMRLQPRLPGLFHAGNNANIAASRNTDSFSRITKPDGVANSRSMGAPFTKNKGAACCASMLELILGATDNCALPTLCPILVDTKYAISMI